MSFNLRLPPALDAAARARAESVGISLNAFVCVALNAYLEAGAASPAAFQPSQAVVVPTSPKKALRGSGKLSKAERVRLYNLRFDQKKLAL